MDFSSKQLVAFDVDDTLTASKQAVNKQMAQSLCDLSKHKKIAIITGGKLDQIKNQIIYHLPCQGQPEKNFYILPISGVDMHQFNTETHEWEFVYSFQFDESDKRRIIQALNEALEEVEFDFNEERWGERTEDRGGQISFSALGQSAPPEAKKVWDPDKSKRKKIQAALQPKIDDIADALIGGTTTIDITKKGVDKGYGVEQMSRYLDIPISDMLFIGDALYDGGNDHPVVRTGIDTIAVDGSDGTVEDTREVIEKIINE